MKVFKIRHTTAGLYATKGTGWSKNGKTWNRMADLKNHIRYVMLNTPYGRQNFPKEYRRDYWSVPPEWWKYIPPEWEVITIEFEVYNEATQTVIPARNLYQ